MSKIKEVKEVKGQSKFVANYVAEFSKTGEQMVTETAENFVEDAIIACELVIDTLENQLKTNTTKLKRANNELARNESVLARKRFEVANDFDSYIDRLNQAKTDVSKAKKVVNEWTAEVSEVEAQLVKYKAIFEDLNAKI